MLVKFWDLDTRHCFKTIVSHRSEINDLILLKDDSRLITGCHDNELRVFEIKYKDNEPVNEDMPDLKKLKVNGHENGIENDEDDENTSLSSSILECKLIGSLIRESKDQLTQISIDPSYTVFTSHSGNEKHFELFKINNQEEIKKRLGKN